MKNIIFKSKLIKSFLDFFSRLAISAIFISAIPSKINRFGKTVEYISAKGIPDPIASVLIFGGNQKIGSIFLLIFLIPTTIIFHIFPFHQRALLMNLGLMGGIIITALRDPK